MRHGVSGYRRGRAAERTGHHGTSTGASPAKQALYVRQSFAIARTNPRIDLLLWFLLRDEERDIGWQSGLITADGLLKPACFAFEQVASTR